MKFDTVSMTILKINSSVHYMNSGDIWHGNSSTSDGDFSGSNIFVSLPDFNKFGPRNSTDKNQSLFNLLESKKIVETDCFCATCLFTKKIKHNLKNIYVH